MQQATQSYDQACPVLEGPEAVLAYSHSTRGYQGRPNKDHTLTHVAHTVCHCSILSLEV